MATRIPKDVLAKPIGDKDIFKLMVFCLGNGCGPLHLEQRRCQTSHSVVLFWPGSRQMAASQRTAESQNEFPLTGEHGTKLTLWAAVSK